MMSLTFALLSRVYEELFFIVGFERQMAQNIFACVKFWWRVHRNIKSHNFYILLLIKSELRFFSNRRRETFNFKSNFYLMLVWRFFTLYSTKFLCITNTLHLFIDLFAWTYQCSSSLFKKKRIKIQVKHKTKKN